MTAAPKGLASPEAPLASKLPRLMLMTDPAPRRLVVASDWIITMPAEPPPMLVVLMVPVPVRVPSWMPSEGGLVREPAPARLPWSVLMLKAPPAGSRTVLLAMRLPVTRVVEPAPRVSTPILPGPRASMAEEDPAATLTLVVAKSVLATLPG